MDKQNKGLTDDNGYNSAADSDEENEGAKIKLRPGDPKQIKLPLKPTEIFRVPIMWMMPDSKVDIYLEEAQAPGTNTEECQLNLMFKNIAQVFN